MTDVPMPENVAVADPSPDLGPALRSLSGAWEGEWGGYRASRLAVETVGRTSATVAYGIVAARNGKGVYQRGAWRCQANVELDGTLTFTLGWARLTFRLSSDGSTLDGTHRLGWLPPGGRVTMRRATK